MNKSSQVKVFIGSNIQMYIAKQSGGKFKHKITEKKSMYRKHGDIVLQTNCTTQILGLLLIGLTSITSCTYANITSCSYNSPYI